MIGVVCKCGQMLDFVILPTGETVEVCACGRRRALRGRTLKEIHREEAKFEAKVTREYVGGIRPCAQQGCKGLTRSERAEYCAKHADERKKACNRLYARERYRALSGWYGRRNARRSTAP